MSDFVKAANGSMIPKENVEKMRHIYKGVLDVINSFDEKDTQIIIDALLNSIMYCSFNSSPKPKLNQIIEATNVLYDWWEKDNKEDRCSKCGGSGTVKGTACICDNCGNVIWGI